MKSIEEVQKIVGLSRRVMQEYEKAGLAEKPDKRNKYGHLLYEENISNGCGSCGFIKN